MREHGDRQMAYYNYKRVVYRDDYEQAKKEIEARDGEEYDNDANYDGEAWLVVEFLLDKYQARIKELEADIAE
jgi:hypothetical protein